MACKVTATAKSGKYTIETTYITDPDRNTVVMRVEFKPKPKDSELRLYVRLDSTVNGNGGGGAGNGGADSATVDGSTGHPVLVSSDPVTATNAANRDYAQPVFARARRVALGAASGFAAPPATASCSSTRSHALAPTYPDAETATSFRPRRSHSTRAARRS